VPLFGNKSTMTLEMDYYFSLSDLCQKPIRSSTCIYIEQIFIEIFNLHILYFLKFYLVPCFIIIISIQITPYRPVLVPGLLDDEFSL